MDNYLLNEIIKITKDKKSKNFWEKTIKVLGEGIVSEELHELKYQIQKGEINNPAKYLTTLLKKQMDKKYSSPLGPQQDQKKDNEMEKIDTFFEESNLTLFENLMPVEPKGKTEKEKMLIPYNNEIIPWLTFFGPEFFTLSTNKAKSDTVNVIVRTHNNKDTEIQMIRGRIKPGAQERGMLTATHGRVFASITQIWNEQGCEYYSYPNDTHVCSCCVSIRQLAKLLGWKKFAGSSFLWLSDMVFDLKTKPFYLDLSSLKLPNLTGYGFTLIKSVTLADGKSKKNQTETVFEIEFSTPVSKQLLFRRAVCRTKELTQISSELAFLLRIYLEPRAITLKGEEFKIELGRLIENLSLPEAEWHERTYARKQQFEKAIKEIKEFKITDGHKIIVSIEKGLFDWLLIAKMF